MGCMFRVFFFLSFFLHVYCLYATLWVMTDLSIFTYKNPAWLAAHQFFISALSRRDLCTTFGDFSLLIHVSGVFLSKFGTPVYFFAFGQVPL